MYNNLNNLVSIEGGASKKKIFYLSRNKFNLIIIDFSEDINEFYKYLNIYNILKNINISIPNIFEVYYKDYIIVMEDFGNQRFDKVINKYDLYTLLKIAVDSLIIINNSTINKIPENLEKYNFDLLKIEINELIQYFFPYKNIDSSLKEEFFEIWQYEYNKFTFEFNSFVHKDFELINLIYLPNKKNHLRCGIIDFQSAFKGFIGWDLFSLLEDSRIYFTRENNEKFIKYFYDNTIQNINFNIFREQYYFLNTARQTRILGRWIKFSMTHKNENYLRFLDPTIKRLREGLINLNNKNLFNIYKKILVL